MLVVLVRVGHVLWLARSLARYIGAPHRHCISHQGEGRRGGSVDLGIAAEQPRDQDVDEDDRTS